MNAEGARIVTEIAALLRRIRALSEQGLYADPGERAAILAEKEDLLARIKKINPGHDEKAPPPGR